MSISTSPNKIF